MNSRREAGRWSRVNRRHGAALFVVVRHGQKLDKSGLAAVDFTENQYQKRKTENIGSDRVSGMAKADSEHRVVVGSNNSIGGVP